jgi:hypothetical protein
VLKTEHLPRQARDTHRENSKKGPFVSIPVAHDFFKVNGKSVFNVMMEKTLKHQGKPSGDRTLLVSKNGVFLSHLYIKTNILPRQARDKHGENSKKDRVSTGGHPVDGCVRKRLFHWAIFRLKKTRIFAKTGSGKT